MTTLKAMIPPPLMKAPAPVAALRLKLITLISHVITNTQAMVLLICSN